MDELTYTDLTARVSVNVHLRETTALRVRKFPGHGEGSVGAPFVSVDIGDGTGVVLLLHDLDELDRLADLIAEARQGMAEMLGLLPNGEPCRFVGLFGSWEWVEHGHDACMAELVDEPVPFVPTGTAWERHDDPTVSDDGSAPVDCGPAVSGGVR